MDKNSQKNQKQEDRNVGSSPGDTIIRKCGTQHSRTNFKNRTSQYLHAALFIPTTASLLKAIKQGFLKTWPGLT